MNGLIIDASVAVKWFLLEEHSSDARHLLDAKHRLFVPDLIFAEVGNVFWKRVRRQEISHDEALAVLNIFHQMAFRVVPTRDLLPAAWQIAVKTDRTVYDSLYLALAVQEGAVLITADRHFFNSLSDGHLVPYIRWIGTIEQN